MSKAAISFGHILLSAGMT